MTSSLQGNLTPSPQPQGSPPRRGLFTWRRALMLLPIAAALFLLIVIAGGAWNGNPDVPEGMHWVNSDEAWSASYWLLRGGSHLILESNKRAEMLMVGGLSVMLTFIGYLLWRLFHDRKEAQRLEKEMTSLSMYILCTIMLLVLPVVSCFELNDYIRGKTVELDPAADEFKLDGVAVEPFHEIRQFSWYTTTGRNASPSYHLRIDMRDRASIDIDAVTMRSDVRSLAEELNVYLAEVRRNPSGP